MPLIFFLVIEYKMEMITEMINNIDNIKRIEQYAKFIDSLSNPIETALEKCQKYWKTVVEKEIKKENECIKHTEIELEKYYAKYGKSGCTIEEIQKRYADEVNAYWIKNKWK